MPITKLKRSKGTKRPATITDNTPAPPPDLTQVDYEREKQAKIDRHYMEDYHAKIDQHRALKPDFVGMYFITFKNKGFLIGQIVAQLSEGYFLIQYDNDIRGDIPALPLMVRSSANFHNNTNSSGYSDWQFFADVKSREKWMAWWHVTRLSKNVLETVSHG